MEKIPILFSFVIAGYKVNVNLAIIDQWVIMAVIMVSVILLTRKLQTVPKGKQVWLELVVGTINNTVGGTMGESYNNFAPYIGTAMIFLFVMNVLGMIGFEPPTSDYSVALGLALISFVVIQATAIKRHGIGSYFTAYAKPFIPMLPLNIIERFVVPVSLSLRLFGNILAASIMMGLVYKGLYFVSHSIFLGFGLGHSTFGLLELIIPIPFHLYFDIFDGTIQMVIFSMLTMIFIKTTSEH